MNIRTKSNKKMNDENETVETSGEEVDTGSAETTFSEPEESSSKDLQSALAQKEHFRKKLKEAEDKLRAADTRPKAPLAVEDYIDISTALDGLDPREKAFLAEQHKQSGRSLAELRQTEDFSFWQSAYRQKQEKENALRPSSTQAVEDAPKSFSERLRGASIAEKEEILKNAGMYKESRPKSDRVGIGINRR